MSGLILLGLRILAAIALYAFLGSTLFILWRSLQQSTLALAAAQIKSVRLLISTPEKDDQQLDFAQNNISIGRDPDCDCILSNSTVSAHHTRLSYHHAQWWVDDLFSTNGTRLNDEQLNSPTVVVNGDIIKCGEIFITIMLKKEDPADKGEIE